MTVLHTTLGALFLRPVGHDPAPRAHFCRSAHPRNAPGHGPGRRRRTWSGVMAPELERARAAGVTALVECTPEGVGRRVDLVQGGFAGGQFPRGGGHRHLPRALGAGLGPGPLRGELSAWMQGELAGGYRRNRGAGGLHQAQRRRRRADPPRRKDLACGGARPRTAVGAAIGSHTIRGRVVRDQLEILEAVGFPRARFICDPRPGRDGFHLNLEIARRGAWISYDGIGWGEDDERLSSASRPCSRPVLASQLMLSMDRGWYDPAQPGGGMPKPFTYLCETFLPKLRAAGVSEEDTLRQLTVRQPLPRLCAVRATRITACIPILQLFIFPHALLLALAAILIWSTLALLGAGWSSLPPLLLLGVALRRAGCQPVRPRGLAHPAAHPGGGGGRHLWLSFPLFPRLRPGPGGGSQPDQLPLAAVDRGAVAAGAARLPAARRITCWGRYWGWPAQG